MKNKKRILGLLLCFVLLVSMLGACSKKETTEETTKDTTKDTTTEETTTDTTTDTTEEVKELEPMELTVAIWGIQDGFDAENAATDTIFNDLCEKFNVTIKPAGVTWNDYQEKNKVWAASGSLPDIFVDALATDNYGLYQTWAEQGIIKELPSDLSAYPNLNILENLDSVKALQVGGKSYMIPRGGDLTMAVSEASGMSRAVMYRKDWAAEAGFTEEPTTYDELITMVKAMMAKHPEATGIAANSKNYLGTLALDIFPELANTASWVYENDQWVPCYASEKTVPYITRLQKLYQDGILDADFVTQKDGDGIGKFTSGNACIMLGSSNFNAQTFMDSNPNVASIDDAIGYITPFTSADGNKYVFANTPFWSESYINATVDDAKLERILMMYDYMYSHEFAGLVNNGIEGTDWEKTEAGNVSLLGDATLADKYPITGSVGWLASWYTGFAQSGDAVISSNPNNAAFTNMSNEMTVWESDNCVAAPINFDILLMNNAEKSSIAGLGNEFVDLADNIIISKDDPREGWESIIKNFNSKGLQEAITSVTQQAADQGIEQ